MDRLEQLVADTLSEHAENAPPLRTSGATLIFRADAPRPWGRWIGSAIAVAAVTMIALSLGLGWWSLSGGEYAGGNGGADMSVGAGAGAAAGRAGHSAPALSASAPSAPAGRAIGSGGTRQVSYHDLTVDVPAALPLAHGVCGRPHDVVVAVTRRGREMDCPYVAPRPIGRVVWLSPARDDIGYAALATRAATLHGVAVRIGFGRLAHSRGVSGVVVIPSRSLVVGATLPTRSAVAAVLDSVRVG